MKVRALCLVLLYVTCRWTAAGQQTLASSSSTSQQSANAKHSSQTAAAGTPQPVPEMQSLAKTIVGRWSTTYQFEPGGMAAKGGSGTGEEVWRTSPGGFVLMEEEHVQAPFGEIFLLALHWWDKRTNRLRGMECTNSSPSTCNMDSYNNSTLKWDGKQLVVDLTFPQNGKKMMWHEVFSDFTATSFTQTGDMGEVGGTLKRAVTIHATKIADR